MEIKSLPQIPERLESQRLILKKHTLELAETMFNMVERNRDNFREFLGWVDGMKEIADEGKFIQMTIDDWSSGTMYDFGIFNKEDDSYIGNIGIHSISWKNDCCEFGYAIDGAHQGKGYISEALQLLEEELFKIGFNRLEIRCNPANTKSNAVAKRNNYIHEGILRKQMMVNGKYRDTAVYSKLKDDLN